MSKHYDKIIDELLVDIAKKGAEAMNAMAQTHHARSKGDDRAEQLAEKWGEYAYSLPRGVAEILKYITDLRAIRDNNASKEWEAIKNKKVLLP